MTEREIEWVRDGYRMFRDSDPAFMDRFEADAKFIFPATLPSGGTYDGPFAALESAPADPFGTAFLATR